MDGLDSLFGGNFAELLKQQKDGGFTNVSTQYTMVQGLSSSGPSSSSDASAKKARFSEGESLTTDAGPIREELRLLQSQYDNEKKSQRETCR